MQKPRISILIVMTFLFAVFLTGFFFYRNYNRRSVIPAAIESVKQPSFSGSADQEETLVNINTATVQELSKLPGIGETLSERIIAYRSIHGPFQEIGELLNVDGIGSGKLKAILDMITTGGN